MGGSLRLLSARQSLALVCSQAEPGNKGDVTVADIMAELYLRQKVDQGLRELDAGEGADHDQAKRRLNALAAGSASPSPRAIARPAIG